MHTIYEWLSRSPVQTLDFFWKLQKLQFSVQFFYPKSVSLELKSQRHFHWCYLVAFLRSPFRKESLLYSTQADECFETEAVKAIAEPGTDPRSYFPPALTFSIFLNPAASEKLPVKQQLHKWSSFSLLSAPLSYVHCLTWHTSLQEQTAVAQQMEHSLLTGTALFGLLSVTAQVLLCAAELFNSVVEV